MKKLVFPFFLLILSVMVSCDPHMVYDQFYTPEDNQWHWNDPGIFEAEITDTLSLHNIYIQVRHTVEYPLSNLYMFVHVKGPGGQTIRDTVNLKIAAEDGQWLGKGTGNLRELRLLYRSQTRFSTSGIYTFTLEQAMRRPELPVTDIGVRLERINP